MAKSFNQKLKLLYLMNILHEKTDDEHGLTMSEIIASLKKFDIEAERKSIYSDLELLEQFGIDIEKRKSSTTTYHMVSRDFELPELKLLVDAVQACKFISPSKSNDLIKKLENLTSKYEATQLQRQVFVANRIKNMNNSIYYAVDDIHRAISSNKKISFQYFEWNMNREKTYKHHGKVYVESPWSLAWAEENYYLITYNSEENIIKHYRVDKIDKVQILDEPREGASNFENFDLALYMRKTFGMYGGKDEQVTLRCHKSLANAIIDRFGQDVIMIPVDEEHFEVSTKVSVSPTFLGWVAIFGTNMIIKSPKSVAQKYVEHISETIKYYEVDDDKK